MLSGRFVHFSGTGLGYPSRFRFIISETMESWLPVVPPGPSFSVLSGPGLRTDNNLLLPLCSDRNSFTCKDGELAGHGGGRARANPREESLASYLLSGNSRMGRGHWGQQSRLRKQWSVGSHWVVRGATLCHPAQLLGGVRALGTHCGDCSIHLFTRHLLSLPDRGLSGCLVGILERRQSGWQVSKTSFPVKSPC